MLHFTLINYELHASCFRLEDSPLLVLFGLNQAGEKFTIPTKLGHQSCASQPIYDFFLTSGGGVLGNF